MPQLWESRIRNTKQLAYNWAVSRAQTLPDVVFHAQFQDGYIKAVQRKGKVQITGRFGGKEDDN